jgi:hypothetical protein
MIVHLNSLSSDWQYESYIILQRFVKVWKVNIYYLWNVCLMHYLSGHCTYLDLTVFPFIVNLGCSNSSGRIKSQFTYTAYRI